MHRFQKLEGTVFFDGALILQGQSQGMLWRPCRKAPAVAQRPAGAVFFISLFYEVRPVMIAATVDRVFRESCDTYSYA
jgi:hypothetical protein